MTTTTFLLQTMRICSTRSCGLRKQLQVIVVFLLLLLWVSPTLCIRCYVCGGHLGRPCEEIRGTTRRSPYVRPSPIPASDGSRQWEVCNDLINNRGCIKTVVNDVVLVRACWMQATDQCLVDGDATVCTCNQDFCNSAFNPNRGNGSLLIIVISATMLLKTWLLRSSVS